MSSNSNFTLIAMLANQIKTVGNAKAQLQLAEKLHRLLSSAIAELKVEVKRGL